MAFVYSDELSKYELSTEHPLRPIRLHHTKELIKACRLFDQPHVSQLKPRVASRQEIETSHDSEYVSCVSAISNGAIAPRMMEFGLGTPDNPARAGIFETTALCVGSTLTASELVTSGRADIAFAPAGGVHHHAMPRSAAGFGIFNDAVIAMKAMVKAGLKVAYVDIDCHHGDGVQVGHYDSDQVLTISIHESGKWLFPGSGFVEETGTGDGMGYSVNVPLAPYTKDEEWHRVFDEVVPQLVRAFSPDVLFTQLGIDTHFQDPLTHLSLTAQGFNLAVKKLGFLGSEIGKWVAVGGGGYDLSAVARAWTMAFATMIKVELPKSVPPEFNNLNIEVFADIPPPLTEDKYLQEIRKHNDQTLNQIRSFVFPKFNV